MSDVPRTRAGSGRPNGNQRSFPQRVVSGWRAMDGEQRLAVLASIGLLVTMFLPWYGLESLNRKTGDIHSHNISAFGDVSFVEAAVFLVAVGVIVMLFARAERRAFHLPGGDGTIVMVAGGWAAFLIFYRVFDRPAGHGYPVGIEWGFFMAFIAAAGLTLAGFRIRTAHRPEPPLPGEPPAPPPTLQRLPEPEPPTAATRVARTRRRPEGPDEIEGQLRLDDPL